MCSNTIGLDAPPACAAASSRSHKGKSIIHDILKIRLSWKTTVLSQTALYSIRVMAYIATFGMKKPVLAKTIGEEMEIPLNFLSKIANRLVQAGLLHSVRGKNGGFVLARRPDDIRLCEIVSLFMNLGDIRQCFLGLDRCMTGCTMHDRWTSIVDQFQALVNETTIDEVLKTGECREEKPSRRRKPHG